MANVATRIRQLSRARLAAIAIVAIAVIGLGIYWFGPQKLFLDTRADERLSGGLHDGSASILAEGSFQSLAHGTTGVARLVQLGDGSLVLELERLDVLAGPDLRVYLSTAPPNAAEDAFDDDFVDLGELRANQGNLVYEVPSDTDVSPVRSVVIWCRRFDVGFGVAPLSQA